MGWKTDILAVAESVQAGNKTMGGYSLGDLTIGLTYLAEERKAEQERDPGAKVKSLEAIGAKKAPPSSKRLETLEWACKLADVAHIGQESVMRKHLLAELDLVLVHAEVESKYRVPAHYWAYNKQSKHVVFGVRGTSSRKDILTDLDSKPELHKGRAVHRGMMEGAKALKEKVFRQLLDLSQEGFQVILVGHSLGAGTASLLAVLLKENIPNLTCYAIAPPAVAELSLAVEAQAYIESLVNHDDIVCRMSFANMRGIREELSTLQWGKLMKEDLMATRTGQMAGYVAGLGVKVSSSGAKAVTQASSYTKIATTKLFSKGPVSSVGSITGLAGPMALAEGVKQMARISFSGKKGKEKSRGDGAPAAAGAMYPEVGPSDSLQQLLPAGRLVCLIRPSSESDVAEAYLDVPHTWQGLNRIEVSDSMIEDHYLTSYFNALASAMGQPRPQAELILSQVMFKLEVGKKAMVGLAEWTKREIKLLKLRRTFFVEYHSPGSSDKKKTRQIRLKGGKVSNMKSSERPHAFIIQADSGKTVKLDPESKEAQEKWITELSTLL